MALEAVCRFIVAVRLLTTTAGPCKYLIKKNVVFTFVVKEIKLNAMLCTPWHAFLCSAE